MLSGRPLRRWLCASLVSVLLFMQFVTAAHACPLLSVADMPVQAMPCAESMADSSDAMPMDASVACIKHCQPDPQGVDAGHAPVLSAPAVVSMLLLVPVDETVSRTPMAQSLDAAQRATPPPPLSILNCCWRI